MDAMTLILVLLAVLGLQLAVTGALRRIAAEIAALRETMERITTTAAPAQRPPPAGPPG